MFTIFGGSKNPEEIRAIVIGEASWSRVLHSKASNTEPEKQRGRWQWTRQSHLPHFRFPHIGLVQKTPESITSATLKEIHCPYLSQQVERKLPPIYKIREKQAANKSFPFSVHDNRYSFENSGYYFDYGLGRKKISPEKRQHISRNFNLWACDFIPSHFDGLSNNRTSYVHKETMVISTFRRFPRCYDEKWSAFKFVPNQSYTEFLKDQPNEEFSDDTKDVSPQEP